MASNDSGVDTSNDSNDSSFIIPHAVELPSLDGFVLPQAWTHHQHQDDNNTAAASASGRSTNASNAVLPSGSSHSLKMVNKSRLRIRLAQTSTYPNILLACNKRRLLVAVNTCSIEHLTRYLECGTDPNCADEHKRSALHLAACRGYTDIVAQLLKYGANPNILDSLGNAPLHLAVISATSHNFNMVVRILLQAGASVHIVNLSGKNPLELAESKLRLMRLRYQHLTPETTKILEDMCRLTITIFRFFCKQKKDIDDLAALEGRMQNLKTNDQVVSEADTLLESVERLSITK